MVIRYSSLPQNQWVTLMEYIQMLVPAVHLIVAPREAVLYLEPCQLSVWAAPTVPLVFRVQTKSLVEFGVDVLQEVHISRILL